MPWCSPGSNEGKRQARQHRAVARVSSGVKSPDMEPRSLGSAPYQLHDLRQMASPLPTPYILFCKVG